MRIVVLTDAGERHYWFANQLIERTGNVAGVITGAKRMDRKVTTGQKILRGLKAGTLWSSIRNFAYHLHYGEAGRRLFAEKGRAEEAAFGGAKARFEEKHAKLRIAHVNAPYRSVNDPYYVEMIRALKPDLIAVMGTCLLGKELIASAPLVLNIHTGLSPYYRGGYTNFWPIIENEYGYFGVTVHTMSLGIDAGDIAYTARPGITIDDTYGTINSRCIGLGVDLMVEAIDRAKKGDLNFAKQWTPGKLYHNRDMHDRAAWLYEKRLKSYLEEYVRREKAGTLDSVNLVENGEVHPCA